MFNGANLRGADLSGARFVGDMRRVDEKSIDGLKQMTEDALEKEDVDLRSSEAAVLKFLKSQLTQNAA